MPHISHKITVSFDPEEAREAGEIYAMTRDGRDDDCTMSMEDTGTTLRMSTEVPYIAFAQTAIKMGGDAMKGFKACDADVSVERVGAEFEVRVKFESSKVDFIPQ